MAQASGLRERWGAAGGVQGCVVVGARFGSELDQELEDKLQRWSVEEADFFSFSLSFFS